MIVLTFDRGCHEDDVVIEVRLVVLDVGRRVCTLEGDSVPVLPQVVEEERVALQERPVVHQHKGLDALLLGLELSAHLAAQQETQSHEGSRRYQFSANACRCVHIYSIIN